MVTQSNETVDLYYNSILNQLSSCVKTSSDYLCLTSTHNSQTFSVFTSIYIPSPNNFKFILFVLKSCFDSIIFHKFLLLHVLPINQTFFQYFHPSHESSHPCCDHMHSISLPPIHNKISANHVSGTEKPNLRCIYITQYIQTFQAQTQIKILKFPRGINIFNQTI